jgi:F1F0 ATPase subunit 2
MHWVIYLISIIGGALLSVIYFFGLWVTVQKITNLNKHYYLVLLLSFLVRVTIALIGFYFILMLGWVPALLALFAFIITRQVVVHKIGAPSSFQTMKEYGN